MTTTTYKTYTPNEIHAFVDSYGDECFQILNALFKQEVSRSREIINKGINKLKSGEFDAKAFSKELFSTDEGIITNPDRAIGNFAQSKLPDADYTTLQYIANSCVRSYMDLIIGKLKEEVADKGEQSGVALN